MRGYTGVIILLLVGLANGTPWAQTPNSSGTNVAQRTDVPRVFVIGDHSEAFEDLSVTYKHSLLGACQYDMEAAYNKWIGMMGDIERFAEQNQVDINGIKLWIKVFWAKDGTVDHIAYHLKPSSRNIKQEDLTFLLSSFAKTYKFDHSADRPFSHYASIAFPLQAKRVGEK